MKIINRIFKVILETLCIVVAFFVVALGLVVWLLYTNPISVKDFLPTLSDKILPANSGLKLDANSAVLGTSFDGDGLFYVKIKDLRLNKADHTSALQLSEVKLSYTLLNVIGFNYVPRMIEISKPSISVTITKDGAWNFYDHSETEIQTQEASSGLSIKPINPQTMMKNIWNYLNSISLKDASVTIDDQQLNQKITLSHFDFDMMKEWDFTYAIKADGKANFQNQETNLELEAQFNYLKQQLSFDLEFDRLFLQHYGRFIPVLQGADLVVNGRIKGIVGLGKACQDWVSCFKKGSFQINTIQPGSLNLPAPLTNLYQMKKLTINGAIGEGISEIKIAKSFFTLEQDITANLEIDITGLGSFLSGGPLEGVKTVLKSDISALPIEEVPNVWPSAIGPDAHAWVKKNLSKGMVDWAKFTLYFTGGNLDDLYGEMPVRNIQVHYLDEMTPVSDFTGFIKLYPDKLIITGNEGHVQQLKVQDAVIHLTQLDQEVSHAKIVLQIAGPVRDAMELISQKPLEYPQMFGFKAKDTSGDATLSVDLDFPLIDDLKVSQVMVDIKSNIQNATFPTGIDGYPLNNARFDLAVSNKKLSVTGEGQLRTVPVMVKWIENFEATKPTDIAAEYEFNIKTTGKGLTKIWPNMTDYVNGGVTVSGHLKRMVSKATNGRFDVDLKQAEVTLYPTTIQKGKDIPMDMDITLNIPKNQKDIQMVVGVNGFANSAKTQPVQIASQFNFGDVFSLKLDKFKSPQTDISGGLKWKSGKVFDLKLDGPTLDLSVENPNKKKTEKVVTKIPVKAIPKIDLDVQCKKLILKKEYPLTNITVSGHKSDYFWESLSATAVGKEPLNINYRADKQLLSAYSKDYGDLLMRLNSADKIIGGVLDVSAKQSSKGGVDGTFTVKKFQLREPGFLIQAFTILGIVDAIRGKDLFFEKAIIPFTISQKPEWLMTIEEGYMSGNSLGVTYTGSLSPQYASLTGSVIPAYMVNSLLGKIPLVGGLFRNGEGGGLVGVRYDLKGSPFHPVIEFQTLSSLAPGILGKLF